MKHCLHAQIMHADGPIQTRQNQHYELRQSVRNASNHKQIRIAEMQALVKSCVLAYHPSGPCDN